MIICVRCYVYNVNVNINIICYLTIVGVNDFINHKNTKEDT